MLRSFLFNLFFWGGFCIFLLVMSPIAMLLSKSQADRLIYKNLGRLLDFCLKLFCNIDYKVIGREKMRQECGQSQIILGCAHQSAWETIIFPLIFDNICIVAKKELFHLPIIRIYMRKFGCISIDRSSPILAIKSLIANGKKAIEKKHSILIFPNGTRQNPSENTEYKVGLFALYKSLNLPVVPVTLNSGALWSKHSFRKKSGTIVLEFKAKIEPGLNKQEFMQIFESRM